VPALPVRLTPFAAVAADQDHFSTGRWRNRWQHCVAGSRFFHLSRCSSDSDVVAGDMALDETKRGWVCAALRCADLPALLVKVSGITHGSKKKSTRARACVHAWKHVLYVQYVHHYAVGIYNYIDGCAAYVNSERRRRGVFSYSPL
jgi:sarcosine oxidase delta subunit